MLPPTRAGVFTAAGRVFGMVVILLAAGHAGTAGDLATTSGAEADHVDGVPVDGWPEPLPVAVFAPPDVKDSLVAQMSEEADPIWRPAGITFEWHRVALADAVSTSWLRGTTS